MVTVRTISVRLTSFVCHNQLLVRFSLSFAVYLKYEDEGPKRQIFHIILQGNNFETEI